MAGKARNTFLEDVVEVTARLPWWVGVALAAVAYGLLHHVATQGIAPPDGRRFSAVLPHLWRGFAGAGQYLVPLAFSIGALVSALTRYRRPHCPKCSKPMAKRTAQQGSNAGKPFWGCTAFPDCRGTRPVQ